jgi:ATP-dependent Clp protease ATP-binding subunit ClpB
MRTMQLSNYSPAAKKILVHSQVLAKGRQNSAIEPEHLALALIQSAELRELLKKKQLDFNKIEHALSILTEALPVQIGYEVSLSGRLLQVLAKAEALHITKGHDQVMVVDLFMALLESREKLGALGAMLSRYFLSEQPAQAGRMPPQSKDGLKSELAKSCVNLNEQARMSLLPPVFGRMEEIDRIIQVLSRKGRNNPILIGEPGVGRRSIVYGLTKKIFDQSIPSFLVSKEILALDVSALVAGTTLRGQFEERMLNLLAELKSSPGQYILFVSDLSMLMGAGGEGASDAANLLKPALSKGDVQMIALATPEGYKKRIENDPSFERLFQPVWIDPPSNEACLTILEGLKESYEQFHGVFIQDEALAAAIDLGAKHLPGRVLPQVALDVLDEACSRHRILIDQKPAPIVSLQAEILGLEMALAEATEKKKPATRLKKQLADQRALLTTMQEDYQQQMAVVESLRSIKKEISLTEASVKKEQDKGEVAKASELKNTVLKNLHDELYKKSQKLESLGQKYPLVDPWVKREDIAQVVSLETGILVQKMIQSEREKLNHMEEWLSGRVIGQKEAIQAVSNAIRRARVGLSDPKKPIGSFLFLGPTGVGKTELARALTSFLFDDERAMVRFDMSEFMERHSIARLIGAPPGYQGFGEGGELTETVRRKPYSVVLFDEIEKAHQDVLNILLQVLDDGRLTDSAGNLVSFANTVVIMTSNVGADILLEVPHNGANAQATRQTVMELLLRHLRPEMINRIDEIVMFNALEKRDVAQIAQLLFDKLKARLALQGFGFELSKEAGERLVELGFDRQYGARPLKRAVQKYLENPLASALVQERFVKGDTIVGSFGKHDVMEFKKA